jgi:hypothetical protein
MFQILNAQNEREPIIQPPAAQKRRRLHRLSAVARPVFVGFVSNISSVLHFRELPELTGTNVYTGCVTDANKRIGDFV